MGFDLMINFYYQGSWFQITVLAVFASLLVYGLFYAIAYAFSLESLKRTSKSEMLQAFATFFIAVFLVYSLSSVEDWMISTFIGQNSYVLCGGDIYFFTTQDNVGGTPVVHGAIANGLEVAKCRFSERALELADYQDKLYDSADDPGNPFSLLTMYVYLAGVPVFNGGMVSSWFHEAESYRLLNNFITVVLVGLNTLIVLINYIEANMLTVFLPLGILLRTFPYTRGIGALFIAMAIGFYYIFPLLFIISDPGFVSVPDAPAIPAVNPATNFCLPTFSGSVSQAKTTGSTFITKNAIVSLSSGQKAVSEFYIQMTIHAFVVFAITIIFIRYMTFLFGGEAYDLLKFISKVV